MKRLNNLVTELLNVESAGGEIEFDNPRDGWVLFIYETGRVEGEAKLTLDSNDQLAARSEAASGMVMRFIPRGHHAVQIFPQEGISSLIIRTIPEIVYANYPSKPNFEAYGDFDWDFLKEVGMLDSVNVIITGNPGDWADDWVRDGKRVIQQVVVPGLRRGDDQNAESIFQYWYSSSGWNHPNSSGIIADEFLASRKDMFPSWVQAIERLVKEGNRTFYPYLGGNPVELKPLIDPLMELPCIFADEVYLRERPTEEEAEQFIGEKLVEHVSDFEKNFPGFTRRLLLVLGYLSGPPESLNADPSVNYKVYMDMQFHRIANDPALQGLWGIEEYLSSYADEEYLRWAARLFRHYCIEGRTDRATNDPYKLDHIQNPDFAEGLEGWKVEPAEPGSTGTRTEEGYGWLEGRYPRSPEGDEFFWMRRSAARPNVLSQEIVNLEPGRLYSVKMYVGDGGDLTNPEIDPVKIQVRGAEMVEKGSFQGAFANCYSHHIDRYGETKTFFNHIRRIFRPVGESAKLEISDWETDAKPGGMVGQELILNFVEVEPFFPA